MKMENTREEDIIAGNPRSNMTIDVKVGINNDGKITALKREVYSSNGARTVYAPAIMATACYRPETMYRPPIVSDEFCFSVIFPLFCVCGSVLACFASVF
ncbi:hypothetical protein AKJ61_03405 [candidate division MSBL1 archaeon SCGC-AAA259B11]|uniref:Aldehyde oxidase/xanthine dehydrogenase first molybdopterin binding domain-containing protein n=1 Tax=candidate division MSBL1 archaeon SCGC-AAA259B11 TaxID=1698260 RepID=A0A133U4Q0_9EURY|nr:hypothetical protein AKJ61_03405 [candidate division MSBL1 archaeon SCGC-AAA259B11]